MFTRNALYAAATAVVITASSHTAHAAEYKLGDLTIKQPTTRATPPTAKVGVGFMTIHNAGTQADTLISGSAAFAGKVEIHTMSMENDVMKMRQLENGLEIPAGGEVVLKSGGYHIMFMKLKAGLKEGETRKVTLNFERAGSIDLDFTVAKLAGHSHKMKHDKKTTH